MSVAFPWVLWGTIGAVVGVVVAHLLSVTQPRALWLPTSRFVPDRAVRAVSRANTPRDVPLLMVRVLLLLCIGCALAGVTWLGARRESVRTMLAIDGRAIVAGDRVLLVRAITDALQRAARNNAPVRAVLLGDTLVHVSDPALAAATLDSVMRARPGRASSSLGATLLRARRAAPALANGADSVALVVMSLERADVTAAALESIRATWPGRIEFVPVPPRARPDDSASRRDQVLVRASADDVVAAAYQRWPDLAAARTLVVRDSVTDADSVAASSGAAVVVWMSEAIPPQWLRLTDTADATAFAIVAADGALVAPMRRIARAPQASRALVWWPDGSAAATEETLGAGCVRWVGFAPPPGDALLSVEARPVLAALASACGELLSIGTAPALDSAQLRQLAGVGALATRAGLDATSPPPVSPLTRWLLVAALLLLVLETLMRTRADRSHDAVRSAGLHHTARDDGRHGAAA